MVTPLASSTPVVPSSIAVATSAPLFTPAPQSIPTSSVTSRTAATVPLTIPGSADVTEMSPPMSSGGSTATYVGPRAARACASSMSAAHAHTSKSSGTWSRSMATCSMLTLCSAWLMRVPVAPRSTAVSGC
ncbi:uncharacterized protein METZ01_LOCUS95705, partial [marine metagenome]